jgi:hypothetical protein
MATATIAPTTLRHDAIKWRLDRFITDGGNRSYHWDLALANIRAIKAMRENGARTVTVQAGVKTGTNARGADVITWMEYATLTVEPGLGVWYEISAGDVDASLKLVDFQGCIIED